MLPSPCSYQTVDLETAELMQPTYMELARTLERFVDLFLCETLSSLAETMAAASAASMSGMLTTQSSHLGQVCVQTCCPYTASLSSAVLFHPA